MDTGRGQSSLPQAWLREAMTVGATQTTWPWKGRAGGYWLEADADPDGSELLKNQPFGLLPWADVLLLSKPLSFATVCLLQSTSYPLESVRRDA